MRWFKNEELKPISSSELAKDKKVKIRFKKKEQPRGITYRLYLSADFIKIAEESGMNFVRFGYDDAKKILMLQLNKNNQGLSLLNKHGKYRNLISATMIVELFEENGIKIPIDETIELESQEKLNFSYYYGDVSSKENKEEKETNKRITA